ncbi:DUF4062 domain-containing protein [Aeromonas veronii]|uniref:DUF4062 domain-containing protein n=1 Tax=Aeromonas veronii TaxID=654 RepID=UPI0026654580|nr:DUF4062 domain-containing protein [Aeromonas veronii]MDO2436859.1 DUF4062 domain-containing protein [Aeromonas veronii]
MEKKYQVFVSSTYIDLLDERKEVTQALLELDCIPIGMELFPASDEDQWSFIKSVIDDCDYYLLILAGRYGSCSESGLSYTEMEYRYAIETGKPVIAFLHQEPETIAAKFSEKDKDMQDKLSNFRMLAQKKLCKFWKTPTELSAVVGRSIVQLKKRSPATGWVKADLVPDEGASQEILRLKNEIDKLKGKLSAQVGTGIDIGELAQGEELFSFPFTAKAKHGWNDYVEAELQATISWNSIFASLAPSMADESDERNLKIRLNQTVVKIEEEKINKQKHFSGYELSAIVDGDVFETVIVQLRALGLIQKSTKNRSVKDKQTYWRLTDKGDSLLVGLRAIKKN